MYWIAGSYLGIAFLVPLTGILSAQYRMKHLVYVYCFLCGSAMSMAIVTFVIFIIHFVHFTLMSDIEFEQKFGAYYDKYTYIFIGIILLIVFPLYIICWAIYLYDGCKFYSGLNEEQQLRGGGIEICEEYGGRVSYKEQKSNDDQIDNKFQQKNYYSMEKDESNKPPSYYTREYI